MQIHELNTFSGIPGETDFLAIDNGFDTAKISAARILEKKVNQPLDEHNQITYGSAGQLLRTKGDGSTEWVDEGLPTDEQTAQAISDWLAAHPEATTTVLDGSLTEAKFSSALKLKAIKDYITPEMFGAVGDGVTDDQQALNNALRYSHNNDIPLYLPKKYYISTPLNFSDMARIRFNIMGSYPKNREASYPYSDIGSLSVIYCPNGFVENSTICGEINGIAFQAAQAAMPVLFGGCSCRFEMHNVAMFNFAYAFKSCTCNMLRIIGCDALTVRNFLYESTFVDSSVEGCYINGGGQNSTGRFAYLSDCNGSNFTNNFIDYYRIMFSYYNDGMGALLSIVSTGNQYQVFRYFDTLTAGSMQSVNDSFAYFNEAYSTSEGYAAIIDTNPIDSQSVTVKPCIGYAVGYGKKRYINVGLLRDYDNVLYVNNFQLYQYKNTVFEFSHVDRASGIEPGEQIVSVYIYTGTSATGNLYRPNVFKCDLLRDVSSVSSIYNGVGNPYAYVYDEIVRYDNNLYLVVPHFYNSGSGMRPDGVLFKQINAA